MKRDVISVIIATFNSQRTLELTLKSLKDQSYPESKIEILIIDGGSQDNTLQIAKQYKCKIINNPKTELVYAKHIGYMNALGKYAVFLDSDEVLENRNSLSLKVDIIKKNKDVKAVMLGGYKSPNGYSDINSYINEFGDPFSYFIYRESKGDKFLIKDWIKRFKNITVLNNEKCLVLNFTQNKSLPLIELWAGGSMIDLEYCKNNFSNIKDNPDLVAHLFYLLNKDGKYLALSKQDFTIHYSADTLNRYFKKLSSRVKNNIFGTQMGYGGYQGRELFQSLWHKVKKYLFVPYSFSLIIPAIDGMYLFLTRNKLVYLLHPVFCFYTSIMICYFLLLKTLKIKYKVGFYGT